jgi:hypothetical protein
MSNTQQLGLVVRSEYLHLSRSLIAMTATLGGLYNGVPRYRATADIVLTINTFPAQLLQDFLRSKKPDIRQTAVALARRAVFAAPEEAVSPAVVREIVPASVGARMTAWLLPRFLRPLGQGATIP